MEIVHNMCKKKLPSENNLPHCQWMILAPENDGYVTLEFQNFNVRKFIALYVRKASNTSSLNSNLSQLS